MNSRELFREQLKKEKFIMEPRSATPEVQAKLPSGSTIMAYVMAPDMDGKVHEAMLVSFIDMGWRGVRVAHFRLDNGEYLGDYIM